MRTRWAERFNECEKAVLESLVNSQVRFVIVGGVAVAFHGCRSEDDSWNDLDLLFPPDFVNATRLQSALNDVRHATNFIPNGVAEHFAKPKKMHKLEMICIDFLTDHSVQEFDRRHASSHITKLNYLDVRVVSPVELVAMKREAVSVEGEVVDKHLRDVECLLALKGLRSP